MRCARTVVAQDQRAEPSASTPTAATVEQQLDAARATALPLGWNGENVGDGSLVWVVLEKIAGILLTGAALMLGAPFWFDVLGKVARLRSSGRRADDLRDAAPPAQPPAVAAVAAAPAAALPAAAAPAAPLTSAPPACPHAACRRRPRMARVRDLLHCDADFLVRIPEGA